MAKLYNENYTKGMWLGLAQGPYGGWQDEAEPPEPTLIPKGNDPTTVSTGQHSDDTGEGSLTNLLGVKHITHHSLVVPIISNDNDTGDLKTPPVDKSNVIVYKSQQWQPVDDKDAVRYGARWLYLETRINPEDLPYGVFRQTGVYYGLKPQSEFQESTADSPDQAYSPSQLQPGVGYLMAYDNQRIQGYYSNVALDLKIVMEF